MVSTPQATVGLAAAADTLPPAAQATRLALRPRKEAMEALELRPLRLLRAAAVVEHLPLAQRQHQRLAAQVEQAQRLLLVVAA